MEKENESNKIDEVKEDQIIEDAFQHLLKLIWHRLIIRR